MLAQVGTVINDDVKLALHLTDRREIRRGTLVCNVRPRSAAGQMLLRFYVDANDRAEWKKAAPRQKRFTIQQTALKQLEGYVSKSQKK